jgi:outer membrane protein OmpA-like peptidoglycan-associated protein
VVKYILLALILCLAPVCANANPGHSGSSGLIQVPSADTLDAGNICLGLWSCSSENRNFSQKRSLVLPVSMTLGIGTFWEIFSSYPNILFNGDEDVSGLGTLNIGTKLRFLGSRSSTFKMAAEFVSQRHVSEKRTVDGVTDISGRVVSSYTTGTVGVHVAAGYTVPGQIAGTRLDPGYTLGVGAEYLVLPRLKLLGELTAATNRHYQEDNPATASSSLELSAGAQYYLSPHLSLNASVGTGLGPHDPGVRIIVGLSSCQGVGSYVKPIPSAGQKSAFKAKPRETLKALKIIPISSLLIKKSADKATPPASFEAEIETDREELIVKPFGDIMIAPQQASSNLTSPVIPVDVTVKVHDEEITLLPRGESVQSAASFDYIMSNVNGVSPLYGISVKGTAAPVSAPAQQPEAMLAEKARLYRKFQFSDGMFELDSSTLSDYGRKMLSEVAEQIRNDVKWSFIRVDGHTDNIGSLVYNMELSLKRAVAAATYLVGSEGVDAAKIFIKGFGKTTPVADNTFADGRRKNRRTEIMLFVTKGNQN